MSACWWPWQHTPRPPAAVAAVVWPTAQEQSLGRAALNPHRRCCWCSRYWYDCCCTLHLRTDNFDHVFLNQIYYLLCWLITRVKREIIWFKKNLNHSLPFIWLVLEISSWDTWRDDLHGIIIKLLHSNTYHFHLQWKNNSRLLLRGFFRLKVVGNQN
jgi:hypothetical protein